MPLGGAAGTVALPKATVSLNPATKPLSPIGGTTMPLASGSTATTIRHATLSAVETEDDESGAKTFTNILSIVGCVAACVVLGLQLMLSNVWITARDFEMQGDFMAIFEEI
jgi:hypothetical protein